MSGIYAPEPWQADPANVKRIMVVVSGEYIVFEHKDPRGLPLKIIERNELPYECNSYELAGLAFATKCGAVWLTDPAPDLLTFDADDSVYTWHELSADGAVCGLVAQKRGADGKGQGMPLAIYNPTVNDPWGIACILPRPYTVDSATRARALAEGVALAAFALGQQLRFSPSYTGNAILRRVLADHPREIPPLSQEWRETLYERRPSPVQWCQPNVAQGMQSAALINGGSDVEVHIYDRNMSYVSSAREVPIGDPVETHEFHPHLPGVYLVGDTWMWEPEVRHWLRSITLKGTPPPQFYYVTGYYWTKEQRIDLRTWHDRIWAARRASRAVESVAGRIAEALVKKIGVSTVGRLIQRRGRKVCTEAEALRDGLRILNYETDDNGRDTGNVEVEAPLGREDMAWPHVWSTIISNANERLWNAIATYAPHDTILAYVDQFYCLSRHPELDEKLDPNKIGGWKYSGSFHVDVSQLERLNTMGAQELVKAFAAMQRAQGMRGVVPVVEVEYGE